MSNYDVSVKTAIDSMMVSQAPAWLPVLAWRLRDAVSAKYPLEVLAVTGLDVQRDVASPVLKVKFRVLAQRGWDLDTSIVLYKNFRFFHPVLAVPIEALPLLSRKQLIETFGDSFGTIIADLMVDPGTQPIFLALLNGTLSNPVTRPLVDAVLCVDVMDDTDPVKIAVDPVQISSIQYVTPGGGLLSDKLVSISEWDAATLWQRAVGTRPNFSTSLSVQDIDYEKIAEAGQTVRQAGGALDQFS